MVRFAMGLRTLGLLGLLHALGGCVAPKMEGVECVFSRDCAQGLICSGSRCRIQCADRRDCMAPNVCVSSGEGTQNACLPPAEPRPCGADSHCPASSRCEMKTCRWTCRTDADCQAQRSGTCELGTSTCSLPVRAGDTFTPTDGGSERDAQSDSEATDASVEAAVDAGADVVSMDVTSMDAAVDATSAMDAAACPVGFADCDGNEANGCETNLQTDPANCGRCGMGCGVGMNATRTCSAGACGMSCNAGFANCDGIDPNGCETALEGNRAHCGRCDNACSAGSFCAPLMGVGASVCQSGGFPAGDAGGALVPDAGFVLTPDGGGDGGATVTTLRDGRNVFGSVTVPAGAEIRSASGVLEIFSDGPVRIDGVIDVSGGRGGNAAPTAGSNSDCRPSGQGGGTGTRVNGIVTATSVCPSASLGGLGAAGGQPAPTLIGCALGGAFGGGNGAAGTPSGGFSGGGGGGGFAGGGGGGVRSSVVGGAGGSSAMANGGPGGGAVPDGGYGGFGGEYNAPAALVAYAGQNGGRDEGVFPFGGGGGGSIGLDAANDLAVSVTTFRPGSGGGGGAWSSCTTGQGGGAGGGGGGGALRIVSNTAIVLGPTARLLAVGGAGGNGTGVANNRAGGGGGSGGVIYLAAPHVEVQAGARVDVTGGAGGTGSSGHNGGNGGLGRVRIAVTPSGCTLAGTFFPPFATGVPCAVTSGAGTPARVYVGTFPPPAM
jgi:hypothetical protein